MAIAGLWQAAYFNRPGYELFDYDVYALGGDGCMMEGISSEAASLAGHLKLSNLCWIYDNNKITIEGNTALAFSEDVATRFIAYGWNVTRVGDANDLEMLTRAFETFKKEDERPRSSSSTATSATARPQSRTRALRTASRSARTRSARRSATTAGPRTPSSSSQTACCEHFADGIGKRGQEAREAWLELYGAYASEHPELADQLLKMQRRELPDGWDSDLPEFPPDEKGVAGRDASAQVLNAIAQNVPWLIGGAADLAPSTKTRLTFEGAGDFSAEDQSGRNLHLGVREHAMGAIVNGLSLSKIRAFGSGFLIFSDYGRSPIRLAAIMEIPAIYIFTHDSIGVGEDGPTHQPIEHLASLRAMPGLITLRPGDANEVAEAWRLIMETQHDPVALVLSRQNMPTLDRTKYAAADGLRQGAYVLADADGGEPEVILMATGTEVGLAVGAYEQLVAEGVGARVVSMPSWELFERQPAEYRNQVLPPQVTARVAVEQASTFGWERYVGLTGHMVGMTTFGASAPLKDLQTKFGFTPDALVAAAKAQLDATAAPTVLDDLTRRGHDVVGVDAGRCQQLRRLARGRHLAHGELHDARPLVRVGER